MLGNFSATLSVLQPQPRERMSIDPEADVCLVVPLMMKAACQSMGRGMRLPPELALGTPVAPIYVNVTHYPYAPNGRLLSNLQSRRPNTSLVIGVLLCRQSRASHGRH